MKNEKLVEATMLALRGKLSEVKGSSKTYTCIEDRQHGDFCVGATMTAEEWGETAMGWADSDGWSDPEEPLLKNFKTEQDCINFIDDMWEITIVPSDSPEAKEFLGEARSHKEDNEKVAPRTTIRNGKEVKITDIQKDLDNTFVGKRYAKGAVANNPYYGGQYYGTTDAEYKSKRNKTGQKRTSTIDMSKKYDVYKADTFETPVTDYQSAMNRYKSYEETGDEDVPIAQSYKKSAQDIVSKERERIANKHTENKKVTEAIDEKSLEISIDLKNKTYQEWFDEMKNKYGLVYQYTSILGPKDAPVGKIYVFKDSEDYNYAITNGREFNKLYDSGKLIIKGKKDIAKKTETKNDLMSFEDWVDYIDIKKEYPEWFKDKQELNRPFLDVINDHMDELNRDYRKYKRSQSKKKTEK